MRSPILISIILVLCLLAQGDRTAIAQPKGGGLLKTNFFRGPALTAQEIDCVIQLAHQCGLQEPEMVGDVGVFPNLKSEPRSLFVKGAEQVDGRSVTTVSLFVGCTNWSRSAPPASARKLGPFFVPEPYLHTNRVTLFSLGTNTAEIAVSGDIPLETADAIVVSFFRRQVRLSKEVRSSDWQDVDVSQPTSLTRLDRSNSYVIVFGSPPRQTINFRYANREVVITWIPGSITY